MTFRGSFNLSKILAICLMLMTSGGFARAKKSELPTTPTEEAEEVLEAATSPGDLDVSALREKYQNAVVKIEFTDISNQEETKLNPTKSESYYSGTEPPHGSGFFISEREIVTNAHVVEQARHGSIRVKTPSTGNVEFKAEVVGVGGSENIDLALLRLPEDELVRLKKRSGLKHIPFLQFGDSDAVKQADSLAIFGFPQSSDEMKVIQAKVTGREYLRLKRGTFICGHQFIEVGPGGVVQPGNSGGPALDRAGHVVGIPSRGSGYGSEQGWIMPSNIVTHFMQRVRDSEAGHKSLQLPKLGITLHENFAGTLVWADAPADLIIFELGVLVNEVIPGSLATEWGIKDGDILVGFANKQKNISCAIDFDGYRVATGKMQTWPPNENLSGPEQTTGPETSKLHLSEMVMLSEPGEDVTLWYVRPGEKGIQKIEKKFEYKEAAPVPHLGAFEKPAFELWGDFVAQDFNDFSVALFEVPIKEIQEGGVLVTFSEPNSLASRRGIEPQARSLYGFSVSDESEASTEWMIIESINNVPVKNLKELKDALRKAEKEFADKQKEPNYKPENRILMKERYVQVGFRTNTHEGTVLHLKPAFPIDEALECKKSTTASGAD